MKNINSTFTTEKNAQGNRPITLIILYDYDGNGNNLYFADYTSDVVFDGLNYPKFPITYDEITESSDGTIDSIKITAGNVNRLLQAYLESYDLREKKIVLRIVWSNQLSDPAAFLDYTYYIDRYTANRDAVQFTCKSILDVLDKQLPGGMYMRTHCRYKTFKGADTCGYAGAESSCNRTMQRCKELNNFERFGGFPSIPIRRLYVS